MSQLATLAACTAISTSLASTAGTGSMWTCSASGPPGASMATARMVAGMVEAPNAAEARETNKQATRTMHAPPGMTAYGVMRSGESSSGNAGVLENSRGERVVRAVEVVAARHLQCIDARGRQLRTQGVLLVRAVDAQGLAWIQLRGLGPDRQRVVIVAA